MAVFLSLRLLLLQGGKMAEGRKKRGGAGLGQGGVGGNYRVLTGRGHGGDGAAGCR